MPVGRIVLRGALQIPPQPRGCVIFAHGAGGSRRNPRNRRVAEALHDVGLATLLFNLLTLEERADESLSRRLRADLPLLAGRLVAALVWMRRQPGLGDLPTGFFGVGTGAAVAMLAAVDVPEVRAVVVRGGRTDLASHVVPRFRTPMQLIVGGNDDLHTAINLETWARLTGEKSIEIVPGAGHLFEEPGALDNVAALAARWFSVHLHPTDRPLR